MTKKVRINSVWFLCLILLFSSCQEEEDDEPFTYPCKSAGIVFMRNESGDDVHLWINAGSGFGGETINANNKLITDDVRIRHVSFYFATETSKVTLSVSMGQNGRTLKTVSMDIQPGAMFWGMVPIQYTDTYKGDIDKIELTDSYNFYYSN